MDVVANDYDPLHDHVAAFCHVCEIIVSVPIHDQRCTRCGVPLALTTPPKGPLPAQPTEVPMPERRYLSETDDAVAQGVLRQVFPNGLSFE